MSGASSSFFSFVCMCVFLVKSNKCVLLKEVECMCHEWRWSIIYASVFNVVCVHCRIENACFLPLGCWVTVHGLSGRNAKEMWPWPHEEPSFCLLVLGKLNCYWMASKVLQCIRFTAVYIKKHKATCIVFNLHNLVELFSFNWKIVVKLTSWT